MTRTVPAAVALLLAALAACGDASPRGVDAAQRGPAASAARAPAPPSAVALDVGAPWTPKRTLHGDGFTLGYPAGARIQALDPDGDERSAVEVAALPGCTEWCRVAVRTYDDDGHEGVVQWVRALVREDSADTGEDDERAYQRPPAAVQLPGQRALRLERTCEDCAWLEWYVGRGGRVVLIELWMDGRIPAADQVRVTAKLEAMLRTFRWDAASREEPVPPAPPVPIES
jgi:hypothetical protein